MLEKNLIKLRWEGLKHIGVKYEYIRNVLYKMYNVDVIESSFPEFINAIPEKYCDINHQEILFELEEVSYKKIAVFSMRDQELEQLGLVEREMFLRINRIEDLVDKKILTMNTLSNVIYPCFVHFGDRFITIKMGQIRKIYLDDFGKNGEIISKEVEYYHCAKFVVDFYNNLVFLFYNDIHGDEDNSKTKAITEKKLAFYNLFCNGNQQTLTIYNFDMHLKRYINNYLASIGSKKDDSIDVDNMDINNTVRLIETIDPVNTRNNLRSSRSDGRHNTHRLNAIRYALDKEEHTVKMIECIINKRWFQFRNSGEIITSGPHFNREVVKDVCGEIFPNYELPSEERRNRQVTS